MIYDRGKKFGKIIDEIVSEDKFFKVDCWCDLLRKSYLSFGVLTNNSIEYMFSSINSISFVSVIQIGHFFVNPL